MGSLRYSIIDIMKTNSLLKPVYIHLKKKMQHSSFKIEDIPTIRTKSATGNEVRYNLVLPTLRNTKVFGGILTTIKILNLLIQQYGHCARIIILCNEKYSEKWTYSVDGFEYDDRADKQLFYIGDGKEIGIKRNDIFIFTSWRTAYSFLPVLNWQIERYGVKDRKALYIIQDYEPGFYAWSAEYLLAESTYRTNSDEMIALYNSRELYDFFREKKYSFAAEAYFEPSLNEILKMRLANRKNIKRKKQILIYGRPSEHRNAFEIIKGGLTLWDIEYNKAGEWKIVSLGEYYEEIKLTNSIINVRGKVSLDEYADIMLASYAGISLMVSPHPSYPPLEMSAFGIRTITNSFENKNLSYFNKNIISVDNCTPFEIARVLKDVCNEYGFVQTEIELENDYFRGGQFESTIRKIGAKIEKMVDTN